MSVVALDAVPTEQGDLGELLLAEHLGALVEMTEVERESFLDVLVVGIPQRTVASRDQVCEPVVSRRLERARRKLRRSWNTAHGVAA
jgi:DNA-directed RNA polymerase specialized sigma24 family protein